MKTKQIIPVATPTYAVWEENEGKRLLYGVDRIFYLALCEDDFSEEVVIPVLNRNDGFYDWGDKNIDVYEEDKYLRWKETVAERGIVEYFRMTEREIELTRMSNDELLQELEKVRKEAGYYDD